MAPIVPGVYELRLKTNPEQLILFGQGKNVACRMSSLLPEPHGCGTRNNTEKRTFVLENLHDIEYRTLACPTPEDALTEEGKLKANRRSYRYPT